MKKALKRNNHELFIVNQDGSKTIIDNTNSVLVGISGNVSGCEISEQDREKGINVKNLIQDE